MTSPFNDFHISVRELKTLLKNPEQTVLLDVRSQEEHHKFNIGGVHIPFDELSQRIHELDKNKSIIAYCFAGVRSFLAVKLLVKAGYQAKSLQGGIEAWQQERNR